LREVDRLTALAGELRRVLRQDAALPAEHLARVFRALELAGEDLDDAAAPLLRAVRRGDGR
jgi:hypothetical protein